MTTTHLRTLHLSCGLAAAVLEQIAASIATEEAHATRAYDLAGRIGMLADEAAQRRVSKDEVRAIIAALKVLADAAQAADPIAASYARDIAELLAATSGLSRASRCRRSSV